ncbi:MAG: endolytic transglycosylase MltG [Parcubacteria group bacterium]|nr:endolytic transglycosylase MltG [Parcubacteria group bacterium]
MSHRAIFLGYVIFAILIIILYYNWGLVTPVAKTFDPKMLSIEKGEGLKEIAAKLESQGLIRDRRIFELYAFLSSARKKFLPGRYEVSPDMSLKNIIRILISETKAPEKTITIPEGLTIKEIAKTLSEKELVNESEFIAATMNPKPEWLIGYQSIQERPDSASLEGYLFPDTYRFYEDSTLEQIIQKMIGNFDDKITPEMRAEMIRQKKSLHTVLTIASIVELEATTESDRRLIADIFLRRLKIGMPLQADPTVDYALGYKKRRHTLDDLKIDSPYNTYLHKELPPGPIDNPGLTSIDAVINPLPNEYWYFFSTPDGKNIFNKTKDGHDKDKAKYL